jgi:hypothetical protein
MLRCQRVVYTNGIESYSIAYLSLSCSSRIQGE